MMMMMMIIIIIIIIIINLTVVPYVFLRCGCMVFAISLYNCSRAPRTGSLLLFISSSGMHEFYVRKRFSTTVWGLKYWKVFGNDRIKAGRSWVVVKSSQFLFKLTQNIDWYKWGLLNIKSKIVKETKFSIVGSLCRVWDTQIVHRTNRVGDPKQEHE